MNSCNVSVIVDKIIATTNSLLIYDWKSTPNILLKEWILRGEELYCTSKLETQGEGCYFSSGEGTYLLRGFIPCFGHSPHSSFDFWPSTTEWLDVVGDYECEEVGLGFGDGNGNGQAFGPTT